MNKKIVNIIVIMLVLVLTGQIGFSSAGLTLSAEASSAGIDDDMLFFEDEDDLFFEDDELLAEDDDSDKNKIQSSHREDRPNILTVGNTTKMHGEFFTSLWGNSTSDIDVRNLLSGYSLAVWDSEMGVFRFDHSVVSGAVVMDDNEGNRNYVAILYEDLFYSDGTPVTAWDYAFSMLLQCDPVIRELGGQPADYSFLLGFEEYASGEAPSLAGLRVVDDRTLVFKVKAEALPYFYEMSRFSICPYPMHVIAPGCRVYDDGTGTFIGNEDEAEAEPLFNAALLSKTITDPVTGYQSHPGVVSGPYCLTSFDGVTARFEKNPYYKGNEKGEKPSIQELIYTLADNETMIQKLCDGEFGLLNKVTMGQTIMQGMTQAVAQSGQSVANYPRVGLTYLYFDPESIPVQEKKVRQAIAYCLDAPEVARQYTGQFGQEVNGLYGLGQWMFQLLSGTVEYPVTEPDPLLPGDELRYEKEVEEWDELSLENLQHYDLDPEKAATLLDEGGWVLDEKGDAYSPDNGSVRCKLIDGNLIPLSLKLAYPMSSAIEPGFTDILLPRLAEVGIQVTLVPIAMDDLVDSHNIRRIAEADLFYLGDNFNISFDPSLFFFPGEGNETDESADTLPAAHAEMNRLAAEMSRTEPTEILGFVKKWIVFQERLSELLPVIPVYSNVYFDFYTPDLYHYEIPAHDSWASAIVPARLYEENELGLVLKELTPDSIWMRYLGLEAPAATAKPADATTPAGIAEPAATEDPEARAVHVVEKLFASLPVAVRETIPEDYSTVNEFLLGTMGGNLSEFEDLTVSMTFQTMYPAGKNVYLLFGIEEKEKVYWDICEGEVREDGSVDVQLDRDMLDVLDGREFALAVVSG